MINAAALAGALKDAYCDVEWREPTAAQRREIEARRKIEREAHRRRLDAYWPEYCRRLMILGQRPNRDEYFRGYE